MGFTRVQVSRLAGPGTSSRLRVSAGFPPDFPCYSRVKPGKHGTLAAVTWTWTLRPEPGAGLPEQEAFTNQGDAESWIGLHWRTLWDAGVTSVTLLSDGESVYDMSLESADQ